MKDFTTEDLNDELRDLYSSRSKSLFISEKDDGGKKFLNHYKKYDFFNVSDLKEGQHFLYEKYLYRRNKGNGSIICYPQMGIYLNMIPIDQTVELEWFNYRRTWEYNTSLSTGASVSDFSSELDSLILWQDTIFVYGVWDTKPNWKQMKKAFDKTWWFHKTKEKMRYLKIHSLLK